MSYPTMQRISDWMNEIAPYETAESYDNVGMLLGQKDRPVKRVLVALDATIDVVKEAIAQNADTILTHHPLFFHARKNLLEGTPEADVICALVRHNINLLSAHTNLDKSEFSGSAAIGRALQLKNLHKEDLLFIGELPSPLMQEMLTERTQEALGAPVRLYGTRKSAPICMVAICGGAGDDLWEDALNAGAQALITGEVRHHNAVAACASHMALLEGGHFATEDILIPVLCERLAKDMTEAGYTVEIVRSQCLPYQGALK